MADGVLAKGASRLREETVCARLPTLSGDRVWLTFKRFTAKDSSDLMAHSQLFSTAAGSTTRLNNALFRSPTWYE